MHSVGIAARFRTYTVPATSNIQHPSEETNKTNKEVVEIIDMRTKISTCGQKIKVLAPFIAQDLQQPMKIGLLLELGLGMVWDTYIRSQHALG